SLQALQAPPSSVERRPVVARLVGAASLAKLEHRESARVKPQDLPRDRVEVAGFQPVSAQKGPLFGASLRRDKARASCAVNERISIAEPCLRVSRTRPALLQIGFFPGRRNPVHSRSSTSVMAADRSHHRSSSATGTSRSLPLRIQRSSSRT